MHKDPPSQARAACVWWLAGRLPRTHAVVRACPLGIARCPRRHASSARTGAVHTTTQAPPSVCTLTWLLASHRHHHLRHLGVLGRIAHQGRHFESCSDTQHVCKHCCAEGHVLPQVSVTLPQLRRFERTVHLGTVSVRALHVGDNVGASALLLCYACLLGVSLQAARIEASC